MGSTWKLATTGPRHFKSCWISIICCSYFPRLACSCLPLEMVPAQTLNLALRLLCHIASEAPLLAHRVRRGWSDQQREQPQNTYGHLLWHLDQERECVEMFGSPCVHSHRPFGIHSLKFEPVILYLLSEADLFHQASASAFYIAWLLLLQTSVFGKYGATSDGLAEVEAWVHTTGQSGSGFGNFVDLSKEVPEGIWSQKRGWQTWFGRGWYILLRKVEPQSGPVHWYWEVVCKHQHGNGQTTSYGQ